MVRDALFPLSYLSLVREDGKLLLRRDFLYLFGVAALTGLLVHFAPNLISSVLPGLLIGLGPFPRP